MTNLLQQLTEKKLKLYKLQPLKKERLKNLEDWLRVELTYSSNAIEGNTLTREETAKVIKKGLKHIKSMAQKKHTLSLNTHNGLLRIGELAKETGETIHTLRYWTKAGLLTVTKYSEGGYQLYSQTMTKRAKEIRRLQKEKRLTIEEIKLLFTS